MEHVKNHGIAFAKKDGVVYSVTRISIIVRITNHVSMVAPASTPVRAPTPAHARQVSTAPTVKDQFLTVNLSHASMAAHAQ